MVDFINSQIYPYGSGLWVKCIVFSSIEYEYLTEYETKNIREVIDNPIFPIINQDQLKDFLISIVDNELLLHLSEEIMIDYIFKNPFNRISKNEGEQIFSDFSELTRDYPSSRDNIKSEILTNQIAYQKIAAYLFESRPSDAVVLYSNIRAYQEPNTVGKRKYYRQNPIFFPCLIAVSKEKIIFSWYNH